MSKKTLAAILIAGLAAPGILGGLPASGSVREPASALEEPLSPVSAPRGRALAPPQKPEKKASFFKRMKARFARFKPVQRKPEKKWDEAEALLSKTTLDEIFDREMSEKMEARYRGAVLPLEKETLDSAHRPSTWELQRYEQSRKDLAEWTMKEVGKTQLKEFLRRQKSGSAALEAVAATSGVQEEASKADDKPLSEKERIARAHSMGAPQEEEEIPTRLRAKLNLLKAKGQLTFSNPVVITSVEAQAGSGDNLAVELNKEFSELEMNSRLRYGVDQSLFVLNFNKRITEEVSLDLNSERWTGSKRGSLGEKSKDTAKLLYSISF